jgi:hypothetical protein
MKAVTHNVLVDLKERGARSVVATALDSRPHIACFQEFNPDNLPILNEYQDYEIRLGHARGLPVLLKKKYVRHVIRTQGLTMAPDFMGGRPTPATEVLFVNKFGVKIGVLNTHPMAHHDKPSYLGAFKVAVKNIEAWGRAAHQDGYVPMVFMDGNGVDVLQGLINCWNGHRRFPTGPGGNTIDGIWTKQYSQSVETFETLSDHNGVLAVYDKL